MNEELCTVENLTIGYHYPRRPEYVVARELNLVLRHGELACLLGPNGSGKSTFLRTVSGTLPSIAGRVFFRGRLLEHHSGRELSQFLSVVLTDRVDVGFLSCYALVALGRHPYTGWSGRISPDDDRIVRWALEAVGADQLVHRYVAELSDGERQKIMIARALAQEPELLLLDEPTAFLDVPRRVEIMQLLKKLAGETSKSILLSTHDLELALRSADRILLLSMEGRLLSGAPEDLVLSGAFEDTFHSEGVVFDREYGHFAITGTQRKSLTVHGRGLGLVWTKRALERVGYRVKDAAAAEKSVVRVISGRGKTRWTTRIQNREQSQSSIEELIAHLKRNL
jgi:iron complex transport system ATP-binding protein